MQKRTTILTLIIAIISLLLGIFIGKELFMNKSLKPLKARNDVFNGQSVLNGDTCLGSQIEEKDGEVSYKEIYKDTLEMDYKAYNLLKDKRCNLAMNYIEHIIRLKVKYPKIWKFHRDMNYSIEPSPPPEYNHIPEKEKHRKLLIEAEKRWDKIFYSIVNNDFETGYITLTQCIEYERESEFYFGGGEHGFVSCTESEDFFYELILSADCCGFLNIMHSKKISYKKKKELIDKLHEMIKKEHDKK